MNQPGSCWATSRRYDLSDTRATRATGQCIWDRRLRVEGIDIMDLAGID